MTSILELMLWDEGATAAQGAGILGARDGIFVRTRRELSSRLGGTWDHTRAGPVQNWREKILRLRNTIVHSGHTATRVEALAALDALNELVVFIADRLSGQKVRAKYLRTIVLSVGQSSLSKRDAWTSRLEKMVKENEGKWRFEFLQWRDDLFDHMPF